jgi:adenylate cyclase
MRLASGSLRFRWHAACVAVGTALVLFSYNARKVSGLADWEYHLQDLWLRATTKENLPGNFLILALDEASLSLDTLEPEEIEASRALQLMKKGYPWSREVYALAGQKVLDAGAKLVIFDQLYLGPNPGDEAFAAFLKKNPGKFAVAGQLEKDVFLQPTAVLDLAAGDAVGYANMITGSASGRNVVRYFRPFWSISEFSGLPRIDGDRVEPALMTVAARQLGHSLKFDEQSLLRFRYSHPGSVQSVSLQELFVPAYWKSKNRNMEMFRNRIVLLGATAEGLKDYHDTPFGRMSGPEIHLHILAAILRDAWLKSAGPGFYSLAVLVAAAGVFALSAVRKSPVWFIFWLAIIALVWFGICLATLAFASLFLPLAPPLATWLICGFLILACDASLEARERARLRRELERSMSKDLVKELIDNPASYFHTQGGERKEIVTLFSDLKGFTGESETMKPEEMVALLNDYFGEMVSVVFQRRGILDKFMGDALMATWGALAESSPRQNARQALQAAFEMRRRLADFNARRTGRVPWQAGIGMTQGMVVFGSIGSEEKREFTAIGDSVNLASRLEGLTRIYGSDILIDDRLAENLRGECQLLLVDVVRVKGRQKPEPIYFPHPGDEPGPWAEAFVRARADYREAKFAEAEKVFRELAAEGLAPTVAALYAERCAEFLKTPPPEDWDGVWDFVTK